MQDIEKVDIHVPLLYQPGELRINDLGVRNEYGADGGAYKVRRVRISARCAHQESQCEQARQGNLEAYIFAPEDTENVVTYVTGHKVFQKLVARFDEHNSTPTKGEH